MKYSKKEFKKRRQNHKIKRVVLSAKQWDVLNLAFDEPTVRGGAFHPVTFQSLIDRGYIEPAPETGMYKLSVAGRSLVAKKKNDDKERRKLEIAFDLAWGKYGDQSIVIHADEGRDRRPVRILGDDRRFDFVFPDYLVAVEIQGGTRNNGAHVRGDGYERDTLKAGDAALLGWQTIALTADMLAKKRQEQTINKLLGILAARAKFAHIGLLMGSQYATLSPDHITLQDANMGMNAKIYADSVWYKPLKSLILNNWLQTSQNAAFWSYRRHFVGDRVILKEQYNAYSAFFRKGKS